MPERCAATKTGVIRLVTIRCVLPEGHQGPHKGHHGKLVTEWERESVKQPR